MYTARALQFFSFSNAPHTHLRTTLKPKSPNQRLNPGQSKAIRKPTSNPSSPPQTNAQGHHRTLNPRKTRALYRIPDSPKTAPTTTSPHAYLGSLAAHAHVSESEVQARARRWSYITIAYAPRAGEESAQERQGTFRAQHETPERCCTGHSAPVLYLGRSIAARARARASYKGRTERASDHRDVFPVVD